MATFDPDAFLAKRPARPAAAFDPDAFLASRSVATPPGQIPVDPTALGPDIAAGPAVPTGRQRVTQAINLVRPTVEMLGGAGGAAVGTVAATPGLGTVAGAGLGYGAAKTGLDFLEQRFGTQQAPANVADALQRGAKDVAVGATLEAGGRAVMANLGPIFSKLGERALKALGSSGSVATKIAQQAAGKDIEAIRAALRGASPDDLPAQATAGIQRKAWQTLNALGAGLDETDVILKRQMDDRLAELAALARGGNATEIRQAVEESRSVLRQITSPMRETELRAANTAGNVMSRLAPRAAERQASMVSALRQGQPMPVAAPRQGGLVTGTVTGEPRVGQSMVVPGTDAAALRTLANQADGPLRPPVPATQPVDQSGAFLRNRLSVAADDAQGTADVFARVAQQRRVERDFINRQIGSLEQNGLRPLSVDNIIDVVNKSMSEPGKRVSPTHQKVMAQVREQLSNLARMNNGTVDARDLYTIRKEGVNEIIDDLMRGADPKVSKKVAADVLAIVRPEIDKAIEAAGGTGWKTYLKTFEQGAKDLEKRQMAAEAFRMFKDNPTEFTRLVRGDNLDAVEAVFGRGNYDIFKEMAKEMPTLNKAAAYIERQGIIDTAAKGGREELASIIENASWKRRLPNWLSPAITTANFAIRETERRLNKESIELIRKATLSNQSMLELLDGLPAKERAKLMSIIASKSFRGPAYMAVPGNPQVPEE